MKWKVFLGLGVPRIILEHDNGIGNSFDLELPREILVDLAKASAAYVFHNGTPEERKELGGWIHEMPEAHWSR